jgi:hypothetical protein
MMDNRKETTLLKFLHVHYNCFCNCHSIIWRIRIAITIKKIVIVILIQHWVVYPNNPSKLEAL